MAWDDADEELAEQGGINFAQAQDQGVVIRSGDFAHRSKVAPAHSGVVGVHDGVVGELDVCGGEGPAVVPHNPTPNAESKG